MAPTPISIPLFAETQLQLLLQEHEAEVSSSSLASTAASVSPSTRRILQATGYALTGLVLSQCRTGMGGRVVGEFTPDPAIASKGEDERADGTPRLGSHGIRVGDVVRVNDVSAAKKVGKDKKDGKEGAKGGPEGVVTRTGDRAIWIAFGQRGGGGRSKEEDEAIEELWGKRLWAWVFSSLETWYGADMNVGLNLPTMLLIDGESDGSYWRM
jgi:DNA polymerase alpha-associated DNA helicase A